MIYATDKNMKTCLSPNDLEIGLRVGVPGRRGFFRGRSGGRLRERETRTEEHEGEEQGRLSHVDFPFSSEQSFYIVCSSSGFCQFPWRRSFHECDGETNQGGGDWRFRAAAQQWGSQGEPACIPLNQISTQAFRRTARTRTLNFNRICNRGWRCILGGEGCPATTVSHGHDSERADARVRSC